MSHCITDDQKILPVNDHTVDTHCNNQSEQHYAPRQAWRSLGLWQQQYQQQPTIMLVNIGIDSYWHDQVIIDQQWWCFVVRF